MDESYARAVMRFFAYLSDKGYIYRGTRMMRKVREEDIVAAVRAEIDAFIAERKTAGATATARTGG